MDGRARTGGGREVAALQNADLEHARFRTGRERDQISTWRTTKAVVGEGRRTTRALSRAPRSCPDAAGPECHLAARRARNGGMQVR